MVSNKFIKSGGEYVPEMGPWLSDQSEPSCEQLRQMWRQSKRHSRAAETTNEIPQYSDPFARASLDAYAAQMLRPRPERRPVVYGRVQQSPTDKSLRPFDVLRRLNGRPMMKSDTSDTDDAAVLFGEEDISPFAKAPAKGSLQNLRDFVREEQGSLIASKGNFIAVSLIGIQSSYLWQLLTILLKNWCLTHNQDMNDFEQ